MKTPESKPTLHVGCSLTNAPTEFVDSVEHLKLLLEKEWEVMKFLGIVAGNASDVYSLDIETNVRHCDAFLAVADYPATGLGWELGVADERRIPTLIVAQREARISRLTTGAALVQPHISLRNYESMDQIPGIINEVFGIMIN